MHVLDRVVFVQGLGLERSGQLARGSLFRPCGSPDSVSIARGYNRSLISDGVWHPYVLQH